MLPCDHHSYVSDCFEKSIMGQLCSGDKLGEKNESYLSWVQIDREIPCKKILKQWKENKKSCIL